MKASEAYKTASTVHTDRSNGELGKILTEIKQVAENGEFALRQEKIHPLTKQALEAEGYKVEHFSDHRENESYYTVSWQGATTPDEEKRAFGWRD